MSTTDDPFRSLDDRARTAAADLHAHAAERPAPAFDPDHAVVTPLPVARPTGPGRYLAVAAVVLVVAAIAGFLVSRSGDDDADKAKVISTDPRPFVAGELPDGFTIAGAGDVDASTGRAANAGTTIEAGPTQLYGPDPTDPKLGIAWYGGWETGASEDDGATEVPLGDGRTAYRYQGMGLGADALFFPEGDRTIALFTSVEGASWLEDLASQVTVGDGGTVDLHGFDLPDGWRPLGEGPDLMSLVAPVIGTSTVDPGHYVLYWRDTGQVVESTEASSVEGSGGGSSGGPDGSAEAEQGSPDPVLPDPASIAISSTQGDTAALYASRLVADATEIAQVRGHEALVSTVSLEGVTDPQRSVTWVERPGELLRVSASGIDEDELLAVAEGVEPADPAEWKDLLERSQLGEFDPANTDDDRVVVGEGRFPDGARWRLLALPSDDPDYPDPSINLTVAVTGGGDSSSSSSGGTGSEMGGTDAAIITSEAILTGGKTYGASLLGSQVARVELRDADGKVVARPEIVEGGGYRGVVVPITPDGAILVALAEDGTVLGQQDLDFDLDDDGGTSGGVGTSKTTIASGSGSSSGSSSGSGSGSGG